MSTTDSLLLGQNAFCQRMLLHYGDNHPQKEHIVLSSKIIKINRKGKEQNRILLLTDKALYNLKENKISSCQRRTDYNIIEAISTSLISTEFTIHIPTEYDYHYKANNACDKNQILFILSQLSNIITHKIDCFHTRNLTVTKSKAKLLSIDQRRQQITPPKSHTQLVGAVHSRMTMSELNQKIQTSKTKLKSEIQSKRFTESISTSYSNSNSNGNSNSNSKMRSYDLFEEYNIDNILKHVNINDQMLVYGYIRKRAIRKYKLKIDSDIMDYCLLYLYAILDVFDINDMHNGDDFIHISKDKKRITVGKNDVLDKIVYGCYNICNNNLKTFMWKLRIKQITYDSIVYIGIGNDIDETMMYKAGGANETFNICKNDRNMGTMLHPFEKGDYIDVILDLVDNVLIFLINCDSMYVVKNIMVDVKEYKLATLLSKTSVVLKDFMIFDGSWSEYQKSRNIQIKYNSKYFC